MNLSMKKKKNKQTYGHEEQTCGCQGGADWDGLGVWG